jgi:hypothetical protein
MKLWEMLQSQKDHEKLEDEGLVRATGKSIIDG